MSNDLPTREELIKNNLCTEIKNVIKTLGESTYHEYGEYIFVKNKPEKWGNDDYIGVAMLISGELVYYWNNKKNPTEYNGMYCVGKGRHHHVEKC